MEDNILTRPATKFGKKELKWVGIILLTLVILASIGLNLKTYIENWEGRLRNEGRDRLFAEILDSIVKRGQYVIEGLDTQGQIRYLILVPKVATTSEQK